MYRYLDIGIDIDVDIGIDIDMDVDVDVNVDVDFLLKQGRTSHTSTSKMLKTMDPYCLYPLFWDVGP